MESYLTPIFIDNPPLIRCCMTEERYDPTDVYTDPHTGLFFVKRQLDNYLNWQCEEQGIDTREGREIYELQIINNK